IRRMDQENRLFKAEWTDHFCFILPDYVNAKATCLICMQTVAVCKAENIKRHFNTMHSASFTSSYPANSDQRKQKIANMMASYKHSVSTMVKSASAQENATATSLQVEWNLAKATKPFVDAELIKNCAKDMVGEVLNNDEKNKRNIMELLKQVPLSANTTARRVEALAKECFSSLLTDLKTAETISLALDSSSDQTDMEQLSIFVRFFNGKTLQEKLLCLTPLPGRTTREILFNELTQFHEKNSLDVRKMVSVATDGAPWMVGPQKGLVSRLATVNPALLTFHCIIHKAVLCAKLCGEMKVVMDTVTRLVNFLRESSSLQHRLLRSFLEEMSAEHTDLLLHNDKQAREALRAQTAGLHHRARIQAAPPGRRPRSGSEISELKQLNLQLQGRNHTVSDMYEAIGTFQTKLKLGVGDMALHLYHAVAVLLLTMFPSTYICQSSFSSMNSIKTQDRNSLSNEHLGQCLRIAATECRLDIRRSAASHRSHFSHWMVSESPALSPKLTIMG
uniref:SPIN-DOC-like zinc-finger domain-containing protein n=1 Tax=Salarias fasciatus TaxID=181472 RepID=A0A672I8Z8_SALFA